MANFKLVTTLAVASLILAACGPTWSTSEVQSKSGSPDSQASTADPQGYAAPAEAAGRTPTNAEKILVTEGDITDRKYKVVGDLKVTVNKTTIFHADPTRELVAKKLREEAAKLGADAVIIVRYGSVGVSFFSWGSLDGRGRAVAFEK